MYTAVRRSWGSGGEDDWEAVPAGGVSHCGQRWWMNRVFLTWGCHSRVPVSCSVPAGLPLLQPGPEYGCWKFVLRSTKWNCGHEGKYAWQVWLFSLGVVGFFCCFFSRTNLPCKVVVLGWLMRLQRFEKWACFLIVFHLAKKISAIYSVLLFSVLLLIYAQFFIIFCFSSLHFFHVPSSPLLRFPLWNQHQVWKLI